MAEKALKLSAAMVEALDEINIHGGKLIRYQGGYWTSPGTAWAGHAPAWYVSTPTINALERREWLRFTEWKQGKNRKFPISAEVVSAPQPPGEA